MRYGRMIALALAASVVCMPGHAATKVELREFTCPVDGTTFKARALVETDAFGGTDSDFCPWPKGSSGLPYRVQVCPKCFYGTRNDYFNQPLPVDIKEKLKTALEKWRTDHPEVKKVEDLTPGQRWELTAICGMVKHNHPPVMGELWQRAAWASRHHALRGTHLGFGDPMSAFEMIDGMALDLKAEKNENKAIDQTFQIIQACHRAGDPKRRDGFVKSLEGKTLKKGVVGAARPTEAGVRGGSALSPETHCRVERGPGEGAGQAGEPACSSLRHRRLHASAGSRRGSGQAVHQGEGVGQDPPRCPENV